MIHHPSPLPTKSIRGYFEAACTDTERERKKETERNIIAREWNIKHIVHILASLIRETSKLFFYIIV
jgi:hypothetical protein